MRNNVEMWVVASISVKNKVFVELRDNAEMKNWLYSNKNVAILKTIRKN